MPVFTFDEASHTYALDGVRLPSVTQLLEPIKPDFSMVPRDVLEAKRALGVAVHLACEIDDQGELDDESTDPGVMAYVAGWRKFRADTGAAIVMNEQRLYHPGLRYAGTIDRLAYLRQRSDQQSTTWLLDLKTSADPEPVHGVQLAGYRELLAGNGNIVDHLKRGTVHLRDDGTYKLHEFKNPSDEAAFRACLAIHSWKEATK